MAEAQFPIRDDHPLVLELISLRTAVARYQHEAHATSVKLQRHSLDTSHALERTHALEIENARLKEEVVVLRTVPEATPHPASLQVQELTLAHRRLSDKLTLTEETFQGTIAELTQSRSDLAKAQHDIDAAYELVARTRAQLVEAEARERELERKARAAEEERKLADLVVQEYADLVRTLEGRPRQVTSPRPSLPLGNESNSSSATLVDSLSEGKSGLQKLLEEFNDETEKLAAETTRLHGEIALLSTRLEAERGRSERDRAQLAESLLRLEAYKIDDNTAAKMVSRYMSVTLVLYYRNSTVMACQHRKFSQSSTDSLQKAMDSMKARHTATTASLRTEIDHFQKALFTERRQSEKLRFALDELTEDISREAYGRRREISLRLAFLGREESLAEGLRRWTRKAKETFCRIISTDSTKDVAGVIQPMFNHVIQDAEGLLESLNGQPTVEDGSIGSLARVVAAQDAISALSRELQVETDRRLDLERRLAQISHELHLSQHPEVASTINRDGDTSIKETQSSTIVVFDQELRPPSTPPIADTQLSRLDLDHCLSFQNASSPIQQPLILISQPDSVLVDKSQAGSGISIGPAEPIEPMQPQISQSIDSSAARPSTKQILAQSDEVEQAADLEFMPIVQNGELDLPTSSPSEEKPPRQYPLTLSEKSEEDSMSIPASAALLGMSKFEAQTQPDVPSIPLPVVDSAVGLLSSVRDPGISSGGSSKPISSLQQPTAPLLNLLDRPENPLLVGLTRVKQRYDDVQRGFHDCDIALKDLQKDLKTVPPTSDMIFVFQKAVERLGDFNEDVRVELEIRITDEARMISGYEALLTIPGAMSEEVNQVELEVEIEAFVNGTDKAVVRATQSFARKLDDLEHDIASLKRALHELSVAVDELPSPPTKASPSWPTWTTGLLSPSRPVSPAQTFGSVMTSPRLRYTSLSHPRKPSDNSPDHGPNPFISLGLRIPMPTIASSPLPPTTSRPRVSSGTYMLGLGARSQSFNFGSLPMKKSPSVSSLRLGKAADNGNDHGATDGDEMSSDVE
ncbi:uncharacterized protein FIBRA_02523 [Fibroporia radiculosa]|uniref:Uncharacterized protein n=1 Tax=Fibroporia radiculosa TaxID=599839 RepID=J4H1W6_9APHY|nr:uncharacterized protein FIBRA_02523 [Fibroporia radiculosa]CCM00489.1 predicted protein [Fibroporia radiculosa]